ncbi:phage tail protein [Candidatus Bipolaricaulota bacterium]
MRKTRIAIIAVVIVCCFAITAQIILTAAPFTVNPERVDPYKQSKFVVKWDGREIYGISKVSGLIRRTEVITHREGGEASTDRRSPGITTYDPIILERGRTHDTDFEQWANKVSRYGASMGSEMSLQNFRKDITIDLLNEAGQLVMSFKVYRCWPSQYVPLRSLDANFSTVAIESITLQHEGWERDYEVVEPVELP